MVRVKSTWSNQASERGQVVLLAALVLVVALIPITAAYLQLGYGGETHAVIGTDAEQDTDRLLERTVQTETDDIPSRYSWSERQDAAERVHERIEPTVESTGAISSRQWHHTATDVQPESRQPVGSCSLSGRTGPPVRTL
jgi:hypothetical protein